MANLKFKTLNLKEFFTIVKTFKADGLTILFEFISDKIFLIKSKDQYGNCLKLSEYKFSDYFGKKDNEIIPGYLTVVFNYDNLVGYLKLHTDYSKCELNLEYETIDDYSHSDKITMKLSNSKTDVLTINMDCNKLDDYKKVLRMNKSDFISKVDFLFSFTLQPKIKRKIKECDDNILKIYLTKEEYGYNVIFTDDDFLLILNEGIEIQNPEEKLVTIDSKYLECLGTESYHVKVSEDYIFFNSTKSNALIMLKTIL